MIVWRAEHRWLLQASYFHLHNVSLIKKKLTQDSMEMIIRAIVIPYLNYTACVATDAQLQLKKSRYEVRCLQKEDYSAPVITTEIHQTFFERYSCWDSYLSERWCWFRYSFGQILRVLSNLTWANISCSQFLRRAARFGWKSCSLAIYVLGLDKPYSGTWWYHQGSFS